MNRIKRAIAFLLAMTLVLAIGESFGCFDSLEVNASDESIAIMNIDTVKVGDYVYMGASSAYGYTGKPLWKVLSVDRNNKTAFLLSVYLWSGNGVDPNAAVEFDLDGEPNYDKGQYNKNQWEGSDAQAWCSDFYKNVLASSNLVKGEAVNETGRTDFYWTSLGAASLSKSDKVFFLSGKEIKQYFNNTNGQGDNRLVTYLHDGTFAIHKGTWYLRSPEYNSDSWAGYVSYTGDVCEIVGKKPTMQEGYAQICARPAFRLDLSSGIYARKDSAGSWAVDTDAITEKIKDTKDLDWTGTYSKKIPSVKKPKYKAGKRCVKVSWKKLSTKKRKKFNKIEIQICPDKKFRKSNTKRIYVSKKKKSVVIRKLKKNKKYWIRIRNVKGKGVKKKVSHWTKPKRIRVK